MLEYYVDTFNMQNWTEIRFWTSIGLIRLMRQNDLFPSQNFQESCTHNISGRTQQSGLANEPLVVQILDWFSKHVKQLIDSALLCFSCSTQINPFLASTGPITRYTVSTYINLITTNIIYIICIYIIYI